ncbi:MAG: cyclic nucleotide-binding domain-containing protein [Candidatus Cloacimonetes bacterium]|nr:cyclic nucleotide-binding domain-containing protein [Candidatus Cloacimonadota bacterium]MBL7086789.1 cyclic nucleotide-binding domain-containing protein [Candidatus Cloacimonadota bacterium]
MRISLKIIRTKKGEEKELVDFLSKVVLFKKLSKSEIRNLQHNLYVRNFKAGEYVFKKKYPNVVLYIVKEGELHTYLDETNKEDVKIIQPFEYFGEIGLFLEEERTANIVAKKDSVLLALSKKDMANYIAEFPKAGIKILYKLGEILCRELINSNTVLSRKNEEIVELINKIRTKEKEIDELNNKSNL